VTIYRDEWGMIPHIYGPTDADAVFGLMYAQAEDDFPRIERKSLVSQGRLAEAEGESALWQDLRMQLFIDREEMQAIYAESPAWLRDLMDAWANGLNFFLHTHPEVEPQVLTRFEPWMALTFSEGSIGGDIERMNLLELEAFTATTCSPSTACSRTTSSAMSASSRPRASRPGMRKPWPARCSFASLAGSPGMGSWPPPQRRTCAPGGAPAALLRIFDAQCLRRP